MEEVNGRKRVKELSRHALVPLVSALVSVLLISALVLVPAVSAEPNGAFRSEMFVELQWDWVGFGGEDPCTWRGEVEGDINGAICITLIGASFPGKTEHYSEQWVITTDDGEIGGVTHKGVWRFANLKFVANGEVTDATGAWSDLVGSHWHYSGTSTEFPVPPGTPVSATGAMIISGS